MVGIRVVANEGNCHGGRLDCETMAEENKIEWDPEDDEPADVSISESGFDTAYERDSGSHTVWFRFGFSIDYESMHKLTRKQCMHVSPISVKSRTVMWRAAFTARLYAQDSP